MKDINTLVPDIYRMLEGGGIQDPIAVSIQHHIYQMKEGLPEGESNFLKDIISLLDKQVISDSKPSDTLRMSNLGTPCITRLWDEVNDPAPRFTSGQDTMRFLYGDLLEAMLIAFAKASGHTVQAEQEEVELHGVKGHIDCIIDGMLVDVKSASQFVFDKFKGNGLLKKDPFGYLSQISSYLKALQGDPRLVHKDKAAFFAINKGSGELSLDVYDMESLLEDKDAEIQERIKIVGLKHRPTWREPDVRQSDSNENRKLGETCRFCSGKFKCFPNLRSFRYSNGIVHLTHVDKVPRVQELGTKPETVPGSDPHPDF